LSRPQKTSSPTFHVPSWRTDDPDAPVATVAPIAERSYFTVALVAESTVTESTLDDTAAASGLDANALIEAVNSEPFSSSCTRLLFGVEELKKVFQLVVISATAADEPLDVPEEAAEDAADAAAVDGAAAAVVAAGADEEVLELLEQADMAAASMRPSAGAK
jgi:hypothetical protein